MKRLILFLLFACLSVVMYADVGNSPPVEKQGIEIVISEDVDFAVIDLVVEKGVCLMCESAMVNCITSNTATIERLNRINEPIRTTQNFKEFDYSFNKFLSLSLNSDDDTKENYKIILEHRIRGHDFM